MYVLLYKNNLFTYNIIFNNFFYLNIFMHRIMRELMQKNALFLRKSTQLHVLHISYFFLKTIVFFAPINLSLIQINCIIKLYNKN